MKPFKVTLFVLYTLGALILIAVLLSDAWKTRRELREEQRQIHLYRQGASQPLAGLSAY